MSKSKNKTWTEINGVYFIDDEVVTDVEGIMIGKDKTWKKI